MKILFYGDSITDMSRNREVDFTPFSFGSGYPFFVEGELATRFPQKYQIYNRGISGDRIVDLYARIKKDCWNIKPDFFSILVGINDIWHELLENNGVDLVRFEKVYDMLLHDTKEALPETKIMLMEPFALKGSGTENNWETFLTVKEYAKIVRRLAEKYGCCFIALQDKFEELSKDIPTSHWLFDGVHPNLAGAKVIADEWLKAFNEINGI